ncbi:hypothetical protein [Bacillus sp. JJ722]|uniref:hypothetical protein n=1 Tax=Bacillus sp. JJ722 TaxID=3122973 RepID=UPI002FFE8443
MSDIIPTFKNDMNLFSFLLAYAAIMINSLPVWFIIAMFIGYIFGSNTRESSIFGMVFTVVAITIYLVINESLTELPEGVPITFSSQIKSYIFGWYLPSTCGGLFGGFVGGLLKKSSFILLVLIPGLILQLFVNGKSSWNDIIGISQNVTFCLMIIGIFIFIFIKNKKNSHLTTYYITTNETVKHKKK